MGEAEGMADVGEEAAHCQIDGKDSVGFAYVDLLLFQTRHPGSHLR